MCPVIQCWQFLVSSLRYVAFSSDIWRKCLIDRFNCNLPQASNDTGKPESWKTLTSYLAKIASAGLDIATVLGKKWFCMLVMYRSSCFNYFR